MITALLVPVEGAVRPVDLPSDRALRTALRNHVGAPRVYDVALTCGPFVRDGDEGITLQLWHNALADQPQNPRIAELIAGTPGVRDVRGPVIVAGQTERTCSLPAAVLDELTGRWSS